MSKPIAVVVGTGAASKTWYLHKELLVNASPFFAAAFNRSPAEATLKTIYFPEDSPDVFAYLIQWLYVGKISGRLFEIRADFSVDEKLAITGTFLQICRLGNKLGCLAFLDLAVFGLINLHHFEVIGSETIRYIFDHFAPKSKLRRFAIDQFRYDLQEEQYGGDTAHFISVVTSAEDFGREFLQTSLEANGGRAVKPQSHTGRYLEVSTGTKEE